jgi:ribonucleoside-diphosphate reductase alpha chain
MQALAHRTWRKDHDAVDRLTDLMENRRFIPGGRYLYAAGRDLHQVNNCVLLRCPDTREGWATTSYQAEMALMTGAGIGVWYGDVRAAGEIIRRTGGIASGPIPKMQQVNETGRHTMQGGNRRSAIWAGLPWWHPDIFEFITVKDWSDEVKALKAKDWNFPAPMDMTNISVTLDDNFFAAYSTPSDPRHEWATRVYRTAVEHMLRHGEPGFSVDRGERGNEVLRNACTEITSADDSDVCNLGSLVLPRFSTPEQFGAAVRDAVLFLTAGTVYSDVPYEKVAEVREKNRRLGLGLIGVHEFCMKQGTRYGTPESFEALQPYMDQYARALEFAWDWQDRYGLSRSAGATAIAPNGTIGIIAESTPSGDPLFAAAERRRVKHANANGQDRWTEHVVVDPVAKRLVDEGVDPAVIEDAYTLAYDPERRLAMTAFLQDHTDHAISGTVNLPAPVTESTEIDYFRDSLMKYLPRLRGITFYPDGARAGQPRTSVPLEWALENEGTVFEGNEETCAGGACGV